MSTNKNDVSDLLQAQPVTVVGRPVKHVLGPQNKAILGNSFLSRNIVSGAGQTQIEQEVGPQTVTIAGEEQWGYNQYLITINSYPTMHVNASSKWQSYFCELKIISNVARFGEIYDNPPAPVFVGANPWSQIQTTIRVDASSSIIAVPAGAGFTARFFQRAVSWVPMLPGVDVTAKMRTNIGFTYGTPKSVQCTYSDYPALLDNVPGLTSRNVWSKPQFAQGIQFDVVDTVGSTLNGLTGYFGIYFWNDVGIIKSVSVNAPFTTMPLIQWPQGAYYVSFENNSSSAALAVYPVNYLSL
jgi:hypothetical protein